MSEQPEAIRLAVENWAEATGMRKGDMICILAGEANRTRKAMNELRLHLGDLLLGGGGRELRMQHPPVSGEGAAGGADRNEHFLRHRTGQRPEVSGDAQGVHRARRMQDGQAQLPRLRQVRQQHFVRVPQHVDDLELAVLGQPFRIQQLGDVVGQPQRAA